MLLYSSRIILLLLSVCVSITSSCQQTTNNKTDSTQLLKLQQQKPEIFTSGFIDVMNSGQVNASARFIRLSIGEPGKFSIPLSLYGGVSNNTFGGQQSNSTTTLQKSNDQLITQYINPLSGLINVSVDGIVYFSNTKKVTKAGFIYQIGERVLTGYKTGPVSNPQTGRPSNFLNGFGTVGLYFQTGAWERNNAKNVGIFWLATRYIACHSSTKSIQEFLPDIQTNGLYHGFSMGFGVGINNLINIKAIFYRYVKKPEIDYFLPIYQFTFNYALKKTNNPYKNSEVSAHGENPLKNVFFLFLRQACHCRFVQEGLLK